MRKQGGLAAGTHRGTNLIDALRGQRVEVEAVSGEMKAPNLIE
jgi:hypothetical protein